MNILPDPVRTPQRSDRLHYATGELLGADDFRAEQTYHRRQLARALAYLHGSGTLAGLRVTLAAEEDPKKPGQPLLDPDDPGKVANPVLRVEPGLAIDRVGRLIEVAKPGCLRLRRWYEYLAGPPKERAQARFTAADLRNAFRPAVAAPPAPVALPAGVVADVFLRFHPCQRGYTPAFASGPFDALDASQPSRIRDAFELELVPRLLDADPPPFDPWSTLPLNASRAELAEAIFTAWGHAAPADGAEKPPLHLDQPEPEKEYRGNSDKTAVLLARLLIPATAPNPNEAPAPDWRPATWAAPGPLVDNLIRNLIVPPAALRRLAQF
jgi:hypothetical protein